MYSMTVVEQRKLRRLTAFDKLSVSRVRSFSYL